VKYCNLIGAATIVAACTSLVYGCDQTLFTASAANNHQKVSGVKRVSNARLLHTMACSLQAVTAAIVHCDGKNNLLIM